MKNFLFFLSLVCITKVEAKRDFSKTPLMRFLQQNFDSCIIHDYYSSWSYRNPNLEIVCIKDTNIFLYTYKPPFELFSRLREPDSLISFYIKQNVTYGSITPALNLYFKQHKRTMCNEIWKRIDSTLIWSTNNYNHKEYVERIENGKCNIHFPPSDTNEHDFYLISKKTIKRLHFYAPQFYYDYTGDAEVRNALDAIKVFNLYFDN